MQNSKILNFAEFQLPVIVKKLYKIDEQGVLEIVVPGRRKRASQIVVQRKSNGDLRICGDVNHKIIFESLSYPK